MRYYIAVVHKDENSAYGLHFPDVPGCFAAADSMDDVVKNGIESLRFYAEDRALPEPRNIEQIRNSKDVATDLADGAFLIAVPLIDDDAHVVRANISMESGVMRAVDAAAKQRGLTRSAFLAQAARKAIEG